jgi:hypothetical protein
MTDTDEVDEYTAIRTLARSLGFHAQVHKGFLPASAEPGREDACWYLQPSKRRYDTRASGAIHSAIRTEKITASFVSVGPSKQLHGHFGLPLPRSQIAGHTRNTKNRIVPANFRFGYTPWPALLGRNFWVGDRCSRPRPDRADFARNVSATGLRHLRSRRTVSDEKRLQSRRLASRTRIPLPRTLTKAYSGCFAWSLPQPAPMRARLFPQLWRRELECRSP